MGEKLKFKKLDERAVIPSRAHIGDIGLDVTAIDVEYDIENDMFIYHTGLACEMAKGYALLCLPRSSNTKTEVYMPNSPGLVDPATYRGEIQFRYKLRDNINTQIGLINIAKGEELGDAVAFFDKVENDITTELVLRLSPYKAGDRVGQFIIVKTEDVDIEEVDDLSETERGEGGFGSTGK